MTAVHRRAGAVLLVLVSCGVVVAQNSRNVDLLANLPIDQRLSDVWGYLDPDTGKEYAIVGHYGGTLIADCSDPTNPTPRANIPSDNPTSSGNRWRDMKTFDRYCYVVSEASAGMQIIDLTDPDNPVKVMTWGGAFWESAHNIAMDLKNGVAYVCGTPTGMHVIDCSQNPANPTYVTSWLPTYVHDLSVQDGLAHLCDTNTNRYTVLDVSALPSLTTQSSTVSAGSSSCHSSWPSRDNRIVALCHETSGGQVVVYDVSDPKRPVLKSIYQTGGPSAIVHNPMMNNRVCHVAWNTEGYQALDLSDPQNPVRVGYYDTWPGPSSGFNGIWGIYARQPSGVVYCTDRDTGLWVLKPKNTPTHYGVDTPGNGIPRLFTFGAAWAGNANFAIECEGAAPQSNGLIVIGTGASQFNLQGVELLIDFGLPHLLAGVATDAEGKCRQALPLAASLPLGVELFFQALVVDGGAPIGLSASRGMKIELFAP